MVRRDAGLDQKEGASPFIHLRPVLHPYLIHVGPTADDTQRHRHHRQHPSHPQQYALHVAPTYAAAPTSCSHVSRWSSTWLMGSSCLLRRPASYLCSLNFAGPSAVGCCSHLWCRCTCWSWAEWPSVRRASRPALHIMIHTGQSHDFDSVQHGTQQRPGTQEKTSPATDDGRYTLLPSTPLHSRSSLLCEQGALPVCTYIPPLKSGSER